jgi:hypothetical protein
MVKDIKDTRNSMPHGKTFTKKFYKKLTDISKAEEIAKVPGFVSKLKGLDFSVNVVKDDVPKGLMYETIPAYKSYCIYIDNEAVCRAHSLHIEYKDMVYLEFSSKRPYKEIVEIVENVYTQAEEILAEHNKKIFNTDSHSFYNKSNK